MDVAPAADRLDDVERAIERLQPWMHQYRFADGVLTGSYKYHGLAETYCVRSSPPSLRAALTAAYEDYLEGRPFYVLDELRARLGEEADDLSYLDIACASGKFSFQLALAGASDVHGVEIRSEQILQCELVRTSREDLSLLPVRFDTVAASADASDFMSGAEYDVVLSLGLLYHLTDPVQHLCNLHRLARRCALVTTLTHAGSPGQWTLILEEPDRITKAVSGTSWVPYYGDVAPLLRRVGFTHVEPIVHPLLASLQNDMLSRRPRRARNLAAHALQTVQRDARAASDAVRRRRLERSVLRRYQNPSYFTFLAWKGDPPATGA